MIAPDDDALLEVLAKLSDADVATLAAARWGTCETGSLMLALLERWAPR